MNISGVTPASGARGSRFSTARRWLLFTASWLLLGAARLVIAAVPFRWVSRLLGEGRAAGSTDGPIPMRAVRRARAVAIALTAAADRTPWRSDCYPQALTARALLIVARTPHVVHFGVRRDARDELLAHAWVTTAGAVVVGGDPAEFTEVAAYGWSPRRMNRG